MVDEGLGRKLRTKKWREQERKDTEWYKQNSERGYRSLLERNERRMAKGKHKAERKESEHKMRCGQQDVLRGGQRKKLMWKEIPAWENSERQWQMSCCQSARKFYTDFKAPLWTWNNLISEIHFDFHSPSSDEDIKKNYRWKNLSVWMTHDFRTLTHWSAEQFYILLHRVWGDIFCSSSWHFWSTQTQCLNLKQDPLLQKKFIIILFFYVLFSVVFFFQ